MCHLAASLWPLEVVSFICLSVSRSLLLGRGRAGLGDALVPPGFQLPVGNVCGRVCVYTYLHLRTHECKCIYAYEAGEHRYNFIIQKRSYCTNSFSKFVISHVYLICIRVHTFPHTNPHPPPPLNEFQVCACVCVCVGGMGGQQKKKKNQQGLESRSIFYIQPIYNPYFELLIRH